MDNDMFLVFKQQSPERERELHTGLPGFCTVSIGKAKRHKINHD